jgi:hypothetical protein
MYKQEFTYSRKSRKLLPEAGQTATRRAESFCQKQARQRPRSRPKFTSRLLPARVYRIAKTIPQTLSGQTATRKSRKLLPEAGQTATRKSRKLLPEAGQTATTLPPKSTSRLLPARVYRIAKDYSPNPAGPSSHPDSTLSAGVSLRIRGTGAD